MLVPAVISMKAFAAPVHSRYSFLLNLSAIDLPQGHGDMESCTALVAKTPRQVWHVIMARTPDISQCDCESSGPNVDSNCRKASCGKMIWQRFHRQQVVGTSAKGCAEPARRWKFFDLVGRRRSPLWTPSLDTLFGRPRTPSRRQLQLQGTTRRWNELYLRKRKASPLQRSPKSCSCLGAWRCPRPQ